MNEPELIVKSAPIDLEICGLLGDKPSDFLVLCFDGVQFEAFGTPYDSPSARAYQQDLVDGLNDRSKKSLWPELWNNWKEQICKQFGLTEAIISADYRPVVSYKISRVCVGYSQHTHAAIGLFQTIAYKLDQWQIFKGKGDNFHIAALDKQNRQFFNSNASLALAISETVLAALKANLKAPEQAEA